MADSRVRIELSTFVRASFRSVLGKENLQVVRQAMRGAGPSESNRNWQRLASN